MLDTHIWTERRSAHQRRYYCRCGTAPSTGRNEKLERMGVLQRGNQQHWLVKIRKSGGGCISQLGLKKERNSGRDSRKKAENVWRRVYMKTARALSCRKGGARLHGSGAEREPDMVVSKRRLRRYLRAQFRTKVKLKNPHCCTALSSDLNGASNGMPLMCHRHAHCRCCEWAACVPDCIGTRYSTVILVNPYKVPCGGLGGTGAGGTPP